MIYYLASTIAIEAENQKEAEKLLEDEKNNENDQSQMAYELLENAQFNGSIGKF